MRNYVLDTSNENVMDVLDHEEQEDDCWNLVEE